ncbi:hypothetical protein [Actinoplanes sp. DH11]|uniref:hypothetical protein n=1 Tax=Actinoplanes sp. DH11 TaxID=2857011 RepID=UPI001E4FE7D4|nr:hypothetical protein [Actinoplanes sp. DH11]
MPNPYVDDRSDAVPAWIVWPVKALAFVVVLPFRLLWEGLRISGRFLLRYVLRPLAWLWEHAVVIPLAWLWRHLVVIPASWLWRYLIVVPARWLWRGIVTLGRWLAWPFVWLWGAAILPALHAVMRWVVVPVAEFLWVWLLAPVGRAIIWFVRTGWDGTTWLGVRFYRYVLRPIGVALAWLWRYTFGALFRGLAYAWRMTVTPAVRWLHTQVLRPAAQATRDMLGALGLRR